MDITHFQPRNGGSIPFDSTEFDAGYLAHLCGEPQCLSGQLLAGPMLMRDAVALSCTP